MLNLILGFYFGGMFVTMVSALVSTLEGKLDTESWKIVSAVILWPLALAIAIFEEFR